VDGETPAQVYFAPSCAWAIADRRRPFGDGGLFGRMRPGEPELLVPAARFAPLPAAPVVEPGGRAPAAFESSGIALDGTLLDDSVDTPAFGDPTLALLLVVEPTSPAIAPFAVFCRGTGVSDTADAATEAGS
jgi:hypothetical protein